MLAHPQLPPGLINHSLDVLREILPSERELIRVVVEVVIELRDDDEEAEGDEVRVFFTFLPLFGGPRLRLLAYLSLFVEPG